MVARGAGPQQCRRDTHCDSCLAHRVHSSAPPYATDSSSAVVFIRGAGVNMLGFLIRDKGAPVVIQAIFLLLPTDIVLTQVDHYIVKLWGCCLASRT